MKEAKSVAGPKRNFYSLVMPKTTKLLFTLVLPLVLIFVAACTSKPKKEKPESKPTSLDLSTLEFYAPAVDVLSKPLGYDESNLLTGDYQSLLNRFSTAPENIGRVGREVGLNAMSAFDHFKGPIGLHAMFAAHFCPDFTMLKRLKDPRVANPVSQPAVFHWINDPAPEGSRAFLETKKLKNGEFQWRIAHYYGDKASDTFVFRYNPATSKFTETIYVPGNALLSFEYVVNYDGTFKRDPKRVVFRASMMKLRSEFDGQFTKDRAVVEWRYKTSEAKAGWTKAAAVGAWGKGDQESFAGLLPTQLAIIGEGRNPIAAVRNKEGRYVKYSSNSALRLLKAPKSVKLTLADWPKTLGLDDTSQFVAAKATLISGPELEASRNPMDPSCAGQTSYQSDFVTANSEFQKALQNEQAQGPASAK